MAWYHLSKHYGPVVGLRLGRQLLIIISGRDAVMRSLLNEDLDGRPDGFAFRHRTMGIRRGKTNLNQRRFIKGNEFTFLLTALNPVLNVVSGSFNNYIPN